ncbi:MAG: hypothetical protein NC307_07670 [Roseburia sp.]|nr:hypothetical protein [Roseburia sp.]
MGFFRKARQIFHDDWCSHCQSEMDVVGKQLYMLKDMMVGHYKTHEDAAYYKKNMVPVTSKAEIPTGVYACGMHQYRCPQCGHRAVKLTVFLPVRDMEKTEQILIFDKGEMEGFGAL